MAKAPRVMFQQRHYEAIAAVIARQGHSFPLSNALDTTARELADMFAADNDRFDRARFLAACGLAS